MTAMLPDTIVIEAEDMDMKNFKTVSGENASGGELVKITDRDGKLSTTFEGDSARYDLTVCVQDECDGASKIEVVIDGKVVGMIVLDQNGDGSGDNNGDFTAFTLEGVDIVNCAEIELRAWRDDGEMVRIDKIELVETGPIMEEVCLLEETFDSDCYWGHSGSDNIVSSDFGIHHGAAVTNGSKDGELVFKTVDTSEFDTVTVTLDAKLADGYFESAGKYADFLRIEIVTEDGVIVLDEFRGDGQKLIGSETGQIIDRGFDGLSYELPEGIDSTQIRIVSDISAKDEVIKIDNVKITGEKPFVPDPGWIKGRLTIDDDCDNTEVNTDRAHGESYWDEGVEGATVQLFSTTGGLVAETTTGPDGWYQFDVPPGEYRVRFPQLEDFEFAEQNVGDEGTDSDANGAGFTDVIRVKSNQIVSEIDASLKPILPGSISGTVFCDDDCDGVQDPEIVTVTKGDNLIKNGDFEWNGGQKYDSAPEGWWDEGHSNWWDWHSSNKGDTLQTKHEGHWGNAHGNTFFELDKGSVLTQKVDVKEAGKYWLTFDVLDNEYLEKWDDAFKVKLNGYTVETVVVTGDGSVKIELWLDEGWNKLQFASKSDVSGRGSGIDNIELRQTIETVEPGEAGKAGVTVILLDASGNPVLGDGGLPVTTVTDADGNYTFEGVAPGDYRVQVVAPDGKTFTTQNVGDDDTIDSDVDGNGISDVVTVGSGEWIKNVDAGVKDEVLGTIAGRYFCDTDDDDLDNGEAEPAIAGAVVILLDAAGNEIARTLTDGNGEYLFTDLPAGDYKVAFQTAPEGKTFVAQGAIVDSVSTDTEASDVDPNQTPMMIGGIEVVMTGVFTLDEGEDETDVDIGVVDVNDIPLAADDMGAICADTSGVDQILLNVLENDSDADGDLLTITDIVDAGADGLIGTADDVTTSVSEGQTVTLTSGAEVTLSGGQLVYNLEGTGAFADVLINDTAMDVFGYVISDGNGGTATANVDIEVKGALNTLETIEESLPETFGFVVTDEFELDPTSSEAFTLTISSDDERFDGLVIEEAYCLAFFEDLVPGTFIEGDVFLALEDAIPADALNQTGAADLMGGQTTARENLDLVNWILNQDFGSMDNGDGTGETYTDAEIQNAIWALTDETIFFGSPDIGTFDNALEIVEAAFNAEDAEGFVPGEGDLVGLFIDPTEESIALTGHAQPFIIGVRFEDLAEECDCPEDEFIL